MKRIAEQRSVHGGCADDILVGDNVFCIPDIENDTAVICHIGKEGLNIESVSIYEYSNLAYSLSKLERTKSYKSSSENIGDIVNEIIEEESRPRPTVRYSITSRRDCISLHEELDVCYSKDIKHSIKYEPTPEELAALEAERKKKEAERERQRKIDERVSALKGTIRELLELGLGVEDISKFINPEKPFSRLRVTEDLRIIVPEKDNLEIELKPLPRALYILFLKHPEGINFKDLVDYKDEIQSIYNTITNRVHMDKASKSVEDLVDPTNNSVHEKCSRIKAAFMKLFGKAGAEQYAITGKAGEAKTIPAARGFVDWEKK